LGCAYFERFHNRKTKAFFREFVYAETRERIVINWVLNKVRRTLFCFRARFFIRLCEFVLRTEFFCLLVQATKGSPNAVLAAIDTCVFAR
jgi:hypothetical protein